MTVRTLFLTLRLQITLFNCMNIFLQVRAVLVFSVIAVTLLDHVSMFVALFTVLVLFYLRTIFNSQILGNTGPQDPTIHFT